MKKKRVILYGNCHIGLIADILSKYPYFLEKYEIIPMEAVCYIKEKSYFDTIDFQSCDVFIHQSIREENPYGIEFSSKNLMERLRKDCQVIAIPNLYRLGDLFFPQFFCAEQLKVRRVISFYRDRIIDSGIKNKISLRKIADDYDMDLTYADAGLIFRNGIEKIRRRESDWDFTVSDYILDHYKTEKLFYDPNHPANSLITFMTENILRILDVCCFSDQLESLVAYKLDAYEMPICMNYYKTLDIYHGETGGYMREYIGAKTRQRKMDVYEYVLQYSALVWQTSDFKFSTRVKSFMKYIYQAYFCNMKRFLLKFFIALFQMIKLGVYGKKMEN